MPLAPSPDVGPATWLTAYPQPWMRLATFGPSTFESYARLRIVPDPTEEGQAEADHGPPVIEEPELEQLRTLVGALSRWTSTPGDAYHCLWDGWGDVGLGEPGVRHEPRAYHLFRGPLSQLGEWGVLLGQGRASERVPAFVWPSDRAWCLAFDVDLHWAGIGASEEAIETIVEELAVPGTLDLVRADPREAQPSYG